VRGIYWAFWRFNGHHATTERGEAKHKESSSGREKETNDRPLAEVGTHCTGETGCEGSAAETQAKELMPYRSRYPFLCFV